MTEKELRGKIAAPIWRALDTEDLTQKELSEETGVPVGVINRMLYEKNTIQLLNLIRLCRFLDISIDEMVGLYDE